MRTNLSQLENISDLETGRAMQAMNRLRIGIATGIQKSFSDIRDCSHGDSIIPGGVNGLIGLDRVQLRCTSIFYSNREMIRVFEDKTTNHYYVLVRDSEGKFEGKSLTNSESDMLVQVVLGTKFTPDPTLLKSLAMLQLLDEICRIDH